MPVQDHNPRHQNRMVISNQWEAYFTNLKANYIGRNIRLERDADLQAGQPGEAAVLTRIGFVPQRKHPKLVVATKDKEYESEVNLVWSLEDEDGRVLAVEVIDKKDHKLIVHFEG